MQLVSTLGNIGEKGGCGQPHPVACIQGPVRIEEELFKDLHALLPGLPEVSPSQEASYTVPGQVMDPALGLQLGHDGVNPRETSPCFLPSSKLLWIGIPGNLTANRISLHLVKIGGVSSDTVKEFPPEQLTPMYSA